jgi:hypothetical protein
VLVQTLPLPLPLDHPQRASRCFWASEEMRYETQATLLRLLALVARHHAAASMCLELTRELDAARIVSMACLAAVADAVMRTPRRRHAPHASPLRQPRLRRPAAPPFPRPVKPAR